MAIASGTEAVGRLVKQRFEDGGQQAPKHLLGDAISNRRGHPKLTALRLKGRLGWATVTHPFHPLLGKRFLVLKVRRVGGHEVLSLLAEDHGAFALPREWTDQADPSPYPTVLEQPPILHAACLLKLSELVQLMKKRD